ncbi:MAG: hypothetical protein WA269_13730 [Candidatus Udaeobacter sp.]
MPLVNRTQELTAVLLIGSACACIAADLSVDEVIQNYRSLRDRQVTIVGLAEVEGSDFYLWDLRDKHHKDLERTVSVVWNMQLPNYPPGSNIAHYTYLNLRRVRISGRIDTGFHGRWGDIPFGVILNTVETLPGDRERRFLKDVGVFHNSIPETVDIRLHNRRGLVYCEMIGIPRGEYGETGIEEGFATVVRSTGGKLTVQSAKVIATCNISLGGAARRYYDSRQHVYYYDISAGKIRLVMPAEGQKRNLLPMVDRN